MNQNLATLQENITILKHDTFESIIHQKKNLEAQLNAIQGGRLKEEGTLG
jgi:hypothetical protein